MAIIDGPERAVVDGDQLNDGYYNFLAASTPIGSVLSWLKDYTNTPALPDGWVECSGQTLSDADSVYNGQVIPDLNGDNRFLRGSSTSGTTGGSDTVTTTDHTHAFAPDANVTSSGTDFGFEDSGAVTTSNNGSEVLSIIPKHYTVVWIMRIK